MANPGMKTYILVTSILMFSIPFGVGLFSVLLCDVGSIISFVIGVLNLFFQVGWWIYGVVVVANGQDTCGGFAAWVWCLMQVLLSGVGIVVIFLIECKFSKSMDQYSYEQYRIKWIRFI